MFIGDDTTKIYVDNFNFLSKEEFGNKVVSNINYNYNLNLKSKYFVNEINKFINGIEKNQLLTKSRRNI